MKDKIFNLNKEFKEKLEKNKKEIIDSFRELEKVTKDIDPICLLTQLAHPLYIAKLFRAKEDFFNENVGNIYSERKLEFLAGFLIARHNNVNKEEIIDVELIDKVNKVVEILDDYFNAINFYHSFTDDKKVNDNYDYKEELILKHAKISSFWIRGDAFPHQLVKFAEDFYSKYDYWFKENLGFTIKEAIIICDAISKLIEKRVYKYCDITIKESKDWVKKQIHNKIFLDTEAEEKEKNANIFFLSTKSNEILTFTVEELYDFSSISIEVCKKVLSRLSQSFGYRNPKFKSTYLDPFSAPWDYNTLYEKPIIKFKEKYFVPLLSIFPTVLFYSFHFDIWEDEKYRERYNEIRGKWLEQKTYQILGKVFPKKEIYLNPKYPDGEEFSDVLILHDRNILIIQCKSKKLTYEARIGSSLDKLKEDLGKGIKEPFKQALKARDYLKKSDYPVVILKNNKKIKIDMHQVDYNNIFLISVTLGQYANIVTRLTNINPTLNLFSSNEYPWAVCLFDLEIIAELLDKPFYFIHYLIKRIDIEKTNFYLEADEIDLLGYYFDQKLIFDHEVFKKFNQKLPSFVALGSYSKIVDKYMIRKYQLKENPRKPRIKIPKEFKNIIFSINKLNIPYKTICMGRLLSIDYHIQVYLSKIINRAKENTKKDNKLHVVYIPIKNRDLNISFISMDAKGDLNKLYMQIKAYSLMVKYKMRSKECIGLGWDLGTDKEIDMAFFVSFEWFQDKVYEKSCKEYLKKVKLINVSD
jgi:hypothetical protein